MSDIFLLIAGLAGLALGGEALVRGAVGLAGRLGLSPMVIGLTLVGFGTSTPELVTSLGAAFAGSPGIAVGNVVGSNIGNALLILGLAAVIAPIAVDPRALRRDGAVMAAATAAAIALMLTGEMTRLAGGALALALLGYLAGTLLAERRRPSPAGEMLEAEAEAVPAAGRGGAWTDLALALGGLGLTLLGARFLVSGAISIAEGLGVPESVIGLTIVAVGTSMPELVTAVVAVRRGQGDVALGNVIGSNIFNLLGILGITALVHPLAVPGEILALDAWVMAGATAAILVFAVTGRRLSRGEGAVLLLAYAAYLGVLLSSL